LRPSPTQRPRIVKIRDNLLDRIAEGEHESWHGEVEGLKVSPAGAETKLAQLDQIARRATTVHLGIPSFSEVVRITAAPAAATRTS
jgi:hypothetical protein